MSKITCTRCHKSFDSVNKDMGVESYICPFCGIDNRPSKDESSDLKLSGLPTNVVQTEPQRQESFTPPDKSKCIWEAEWKTRPFQAYIETVKSVITQPVDYFRTILPFEDYMALAIFIFINSFIGIFASLLFQFTFKGILNPATVIGLPFVICGSVTLPFIAVLLAFLIGGLLHVFYNFIGGSEKTYSTTITVYGLGSAASLFGIIPFLGGMIHFVYFIIINIFGQAEAHEITPGKAALSLILPVLIVCCLIGTIIFGIIMLAGGVGVFVESLQN